MAENPEVRNGTGSTQLPQGAATQLNAGYAAAKPDEVPGRFPEKQQAPSRPQVNVVPNPGQDQTGMDSFLFGPTQRPFEPVTAGMPFGEGPGFIRRGTESTSQFEKRVANMLLNSPYASAQTRAMAARMIDAT